MTAALIILAIHLASAAWFWWALHTAPEGWEDANGWHPGEPDE